MRNYAALSSPEFEAFVGDLMGAELGARFERFASGGDGGIDLRHIGDGGPDVLQAKHYAGSTWSNLKSAVKEERKRLDRLDPPSATYRLVTSLGLTPARKKVLAELLGEHVSSDDDVYGREDVDDILDRHGDVERRHVKLWLASATALRAAVAGEVFARSRSLQAEIESYDWDSQYPGLFIPQAESVEFGPVSSIRTFLQTLERVLPAGSNAVLSCPKDYETSPLLPFLRSHEIKDAPHVAGHDMATWAITLDTETMSEYWRIAGDRDGDELVGGSIAVHKDGAVLVQMPDTPIGTFRPVLIFPRAPRDVLNQLR